MTDLAKLAYQINRCRDERAAIEAELRRVTLTTPLARIRLLKARHAWLSGRIAALERRAAR